MGSSATGAVAEVAQDRGEIGLVAAQELDHVLHTQLVKVDAALAPAHVDEGLEHLLQERVSDRHQVGDVAGDQGGPVDACSSRYGRSRRSAGRVGDGLGVGVGEVGLGQVVQERDLKGLQAAQGPLLRFERHQGGRLVADAARQQRQPLSEASAADDDLRGGGRRAPIGRASPSASSIVGQRRQALRVAATWSSLSAVSAPSQPSTRRVGNCPPPGGSGRRSRALPVPSPPKLETKSRSSISHTGWSGLWLRPRDTNARRMRRMTTIGRRLVSNSR